ncbi:MAG: YbbR-like domain-containing protein, partial [Gemmiger sp.]
PESPKKDTPRKEHASIWDNRAFLWIVAAVAALILWNLVTLVFDPRTTVFRNNTVDYSYNSSAYTVQGLSIVETSDVGSVRVQFEGNGTVIGNMNSADFVVYPDYSGVKGAGETTLKLLVRITNTSYSGVTAKVLSPQTVDVVFDTVGEKTVPVQVEANDIQVADNYVLNRTTAVPGEVTLTGPVSELEKINGVFAPVTVDGELTESRTITTMLELRDENGNAYTPEYVTLDNDAASVTLTVYEVKEFPLVIDFINAPNNFDTSSLKYTLSQQTLTVQGPAKTVDALSELSVASFDLGQSFAFDRDYTLQVELPAGLESQDGVSSVTLSFDTSEMGTKTLNVSNIKCINVPLNCDVEPLSDRVQNVILYGPKEEIDQLSAESVVAQIDCQSISVSAGQQTMPVTIQIPSSTRIFATGSYTVQCQVTSK